MKMFRIALLGLATTLLTLLALLAGLWLWTGNATSLATTLARFAQYLPADQTLMVQGVSGSLREGGHIDTLRWTQGGLSVQAQDVHIGWALRPLWDRELKLIPLTIGHLRVEDRRAPAPAQTPQPPANLQLPLKLDIPFVIETLDWVGPPGLQITGLRGNYSFDSTLHKLDVGQVRISSGTYQLKASLQSQAPMALAVTLDGEVDAPVPARQQAIKVRAHAELSGALADPKAQLQLQAALTPELTGSPQTALRATLSAELQPWQVQPLAQATARWQGLNLAALWPQAPTTQLAGSAQVEPDGAGWQAALQLTNTGSGPWDRQRLPLEKLDARVQFSNGQWALQSLTAQGAGGALEAQGQFSSAPTDPATAPDWRLKGTARGVNPAAVDSRLASVKLNGQFNAHQTPAGIEFDGDLQPSTRQPATQEADLLRGFKLQSLLTKGLWRAPTLQLNQLRVQTSDATLDGQLTLHTITQAAEGQLALTLPGAKATIRGHLASSRGEGQLQASVTNAERTSQWLARLPGAPVRLTQIRLQGGAELTARWQGGWQNLGQDLRITASLRAPKLDWRKAAQTPDQTLHLRQAQVDLSGTLRDLTLGLKGELKTTGQNLTLQSTLRAGRLNDTDWQGSIDSAQLTAQTPSPPGTWTLALQDRVRLEFKQTQSAQTLSVSAGSARLSGPAPGIARLNWQAARWSAPTTGRLTASSWQTQGTLQDLPLGWLELLGKTQLANLGLKGDLMFGGHWDASQTGSTLNLKATLERTRGDLHLQAEDAPAGQLSAGIREARLSLSADNDVLNANLRWDSERAGQVQADLRSRLSRQDGAWTLTAQAPLSGQLTAKLPPVSAWSMLAPPGWRLRGTLETQAVLSGTLGAPQWQGDLVANDLAVRSVVDGIDFSQGTLRARLAGQRLEIQEFKLQGAGGSNGGQLRVKGSVLWLPEGPGATSAATRLHMDLEATAQALRLSDRADRRLVASGTVTARLVDARLLIRGKLTADQALFILPDDSTPRLGEDVKVRRPQDQQAPPQPPQSASGVRVVPDVAITLDLGQNFVIRGRGLNTRLAGNLSLISNPATQQIPRLTGELHTVRGTFKAYDQQLAIEVGVIRFVGPLDNPALDILAIRPNLQQSVGVQISGTALAPVVRLYADPDLPEAEKLAWLVLGRASSSGEAESALLQQAALALMGGNGKSISSQLAESLGLDELSMRGGAGETTSGATVTLGKRLSKDFYVSYESSLAGTMGTLYIFYDLSRRFTLRAQTGEQSAIDLIFTLRYD